MRLKSAVIASLFAFSCAVAHAQGGIYLNPLFSNITSSAPDQGTYSFLGRNTTQRMFGGVAIGGYYDFANSGNLWGGIDMRDSVLHSNGALLNVFSFGPHISYKSPTSRFRPYVEPTIGIATSRSPHTQLRSNKASFGILGGVDYAAKKHLDLRLFEIGYSSATTSNSQTFGATQSVPNVKLLSFSAGLVLRIP